MIRILLPEKCHFKTLEKNDTKVKIAGVVKNIAVVVLA